MKKFFLAFIIGLGLIGWLVVLYQNSLQEKSERRIVENVLKEVELDQQIKDYIRQEVESKKKEQELVLQIERESQLKDYIQKQLEASENKLLDITKQLENIFANTIEEQSSQQTKLINQIQQDCLLVIAESKKKIIFLEEKFSEQEKQFLGLSGSLARIENRLEECNQELREWKLKRSELESRLSTLEEKPSSEDKNQTGQE